MLILQNNFVEYQIEEKEKSNMSSDNGRTSSYTKFYIIFQVIYLNNYDFLMIFVFMSFNFR